MTSIAAQIDKYETWDKKVEASRVEPLPERLNEFLALQISDSSKEELVKWFK
jgi:hypothetical protein